MDAYGGLNNSANTFSPVLLDDYKEQITYDPNDNILTYKRNEDAVRLTMNNLTCSYKPNTNQLDKVTDAAPDVASGEYDKYNDIKQGQQDGNYQYDAIGNLISDVSEGITNIEWTVYGKIKSITKTGGVSISYGYDASGNRISKNVNGKETWYVRDASGNVMSVYSKEPTQHSGHLMQTEVHLYGSARLGILNTDTDMEATPSEGNIITFSTGNKFFELTNHLGNVLATVSDRKLSHSTDGTYIDYYTANVVSANDYYPDGMIMPGRKFSVEGYRYGFNGKELDKETSATTAYDYGFRIYSPALGRFLSVDPLTKSYPWLTPYQFAGNNPIRFIDLDGLEVANPSIFRTAWNAITGDFHLNRMNSYLTENKLSSDNVIELNNETSVVYQVQKNAATGTNQTIYSVFRKARQGRDCLFCGQSSKDDDIGLTENEFLNTIVLSAHIMDAPIGLGGASKIGAVINGSKNAYYSFRQTVGVVRQGLRALGNWKNEITFGAPVATSSTADLIKKGFHLHFENLGGLELGLSTTEEGQLALKWLKVGKPELADDAVKLFSKAISNNSFRAELLSRLKSAAETLGDATKFWAKGSREAEMTTNSLNEVRNVITTIEKNYVPK